MACMCDSSRNARSSAWESIKIDRSFVAEMTRQPEAFEIVRTLGITYGKGDYLSYALEPIAAVENAKRFLPASFAQ